MSADPAIVLSPDAETPGASVRLGGDAIETLRRNLAALRSAGHITNEDADEWIDSVLDLAPAEQPAGEPWPADLRERAEREIAANRDAGPGPFAPLVLLGVAPPWAVLAAWQQELEETGPCRRQFAIVHADVRSLLAGLSLLDLTGPARHELFDWFCGPDAIARFEGWCRSRLHLRGPERIVVADDSPDLRALAPRIVEIVKAAETQASVRARAAAERLQRRYAGRSALDARRSMQDAVHGRKSLKILLFSSRGTTFIRHSIASLAEAFGELGHTTEIVEEPDAASAFTDLACAEAIDRIDPDLLILPNIPRGAFHGAIPDGVPCVCWLQDAMSPAMNAQVGRSQTELDVTAGNTIPDLHDVFGYSRLTAMPYPVPACPRRFHPGPIGEELRERFDCEIAFVSHHGESPEAMRDRLVRELASADGGDAIVRAVYDAAHQLVDSAATEGIAERLAPAARAALAEIGGHEPNDTQVSMVVHQLLLPMAGRIFRHGTLRMAARVAERRGWRLRLYGRGWDRSEEFARYAAGPVEHGEELRACYQGARAHLHADLNTLTHQRVIECVLSGGLPLCRFHADVLQPAAPAAQGELLDLAEPTRSEPDGTTVFEHPSTPLAREYARQRRLLGVSNDDAIHVPPDIRCVNAHVREVRWGPFDVCSLFGDLSRVTFADEASLEAGLEDAIEDPKHREERIDMISRNVVLHLTTDVFARRLLFHCSLFMGLRSWCRANGAAWPPDIATCMTWHSTTRNPPVRGEVWFAIPSAGVERCRERLPAWRNMGYRIAVLQNGERGKIPADRVVWRDEYPGWAASVNLLCRDVVPPDAVAVVTGGDDMLPDPDRSADDLLSDMRQRFPDSFGVMQPTGDPHMNAREYCGSPWLGRAWIDQAYGGRGPLWPEYRHNWADHELFWVTRGLGVLFEHDGASQRHEHFTRTGEAPPAFWDHAVAATDRHDVELFITRLWRDFPGHAPSGNRPAVSPTWWRGGSPGLAERYWATRYGRDRLAGQATRRLKQALEECATRGLRRVAIYGVGTETRSAADALMDPPVEIVGLIDDDPRLNGTRLWGFPVVSVDAARAFRPDAVVLSSRSVNGTLARRAAPLAGAGAVLIDSGSERQEATCG